jgi:hypothetical protein
LVLSNSAGSASAFGELARSFTGGSQSTTSRRLKGLQSA